MEMNKQQGKKKKKKEEEKGLGAAGDTKGGVGMVCLPAEQAG